MNAVIEKHRIELQRALERMKRNLRDIRGGIRWGKDNRVQSATVRVMMETDAAQLELEIAALEAVLTAKSARAEVA